MLGEGMVQLRGGPVSLDLLRSSGTVAHLTTRDDTGFDYTQGDRLAERSRDTFYHLGDLDLRLRVQGQSGWTDYSTAYRRQPVRVLRMDATHFVADLAPTLPADIPLAVARTWEVTPQGLRLKYTLTNRGTLPVHMGGVGIPMVFNNNMNGRTLEQAYTNCSFYDPYIGEDAGYVQVVRLTGTGPALLLLPDGHTPMEAWKPILDARVPGAKTSEAPGELLNDPTPRGMTYEGSFDWMVHSAGFAESDWKQTTGTTPAEWNPPTEAVLAPGESVTYGLRIVVSPTVREIESTLTANARPVAIGIPGYILPQDTPGRLFLRYGSAVRAVTSEPLGALEVHDDGSARDPRWHAYTLRGVRFGRARLRVEYTDGSVQSIGYETIKPESATVASLGSFLFHQQWFDDPSDPFHRSPSVISYDDSAGAQVRQESRVWIAGLSDEAGAGSWLAAAVKESVQPQPDEVARLERFVNETLWGQLQVKDGPEKFGVHKSLFYYQPAEMPGDTYDPKLNWKTWTSWNRKDAADLGRSYNYPHVVAAYWSLYHVARNSQGLVAAQSWQWYLNQAFETTMAMKTLAPYYTQFGLMEGTVFLRLLEDLKQEGWTEKAATLESWMRERANYWRTEPYPFGSEMPWDSTGQEEVYDWTHYFGMNQKAQVTLDAILAYTPVEPSWGYNGSSRRFWDFLYGGKYPRIERQLHHYGSGLNAIPLMSFYRSHPDDLYVLRAGYGGTMGAISNIDAKGFASAAFHSFPDRMAPDPYTGDYGPNFFGFAMNTGTDIALEPRFGWLAFGGTVRDKPGGAVQIVPTDAGRQSLFLAPLGLWVRLDEGRIESATYFPSRRRLDVALAPATRYENTARVRVENTVGAGTFRVSGAHLANSEYETRLGERTTVLTINAVQP
jgi:hypothetical protein